MKAASAGSVRLNKEHFIMGRPFAVQLLRLAVAAAILSYLFSRVPASQVLVILHRADSSWVVVAFLQTLLVQVVAAKRLKIIADAHHLGLTTRQVLAINLATRFYGLFLPGGNLRATVVRVVKLVQVRPHYAGAITALTLDRLMATLTMCLVGIMFWLLASPPEQLGWLLSMSLVFLSLAMLCVWFYMWPMDPGKVDDTTARFLKSWLRSINMVVSEARKTTTTRLGWIMGWSLLGHLTGVGEYVALAQSLDLMVGVFAIGWIRTAMQLATLIPVSPSGLGLREGAALFGGRPPDRDKAVSHGA